MGIRCFPLSIKKLCQSTLFTISSTESIFIRIIYLFKNPPLKTRVCLVNFKNNTAILHCKMERISQADKPLEDVVQQGDILIIEKEVEGRVVDRQAGFFYGLYDGHLVFTGFDVIIPTEDLDQGMSDIYLTPQYDLNPRFEEITHYYHIPHSEFSQ